MKKFVIAAASALFATIAAPAAMANGAQPVELQGGVKVDKLVVENGKEKHVYSDPKVVVPGDKLVFTTTYSNTGAEPVRNFVVTNPLPAAVALAPEGAEKQDVSVDGGKSWGKLGMLKVSDAAGQRSAQASDVTHVRWVLPLLAPGARGAVTYNAIVR
ncbi:hypothetical protein [Novosphingobium sp.]|uniref:hypothetical protein n=1 Tax=Novosphingobium sp. TaxID=1874826 RepID=UPI0025FC384C|nr:hypothetical protein [Novosphingobium sp.]MCC6924338.1 DUF11 domain-containing protein [Novosphingobium sp.]